MKTLNKSVLYHTAAEPGWYSVDRFQWLFIGDDMVGWDLTRRRAVGPLGAAGQTVVRVIAKDSFAVLDAGVANVDMLSYTDGQAVIDAREAQFPFVKNYCKGVWRVPPSEFVYYSPTGAAVTLDGSSLVGVSMGRGFYKVTIGNAEKGRYVFQVGSPPAG